MKRVNAQFHQVGYAVGQRARLAATGTSDNHHRPVDTLGGLALRFIQLVKQFTHFSLRIETAKIRFFPDIQTKKILRNSQNTSI